MPKYVKKRRNRILNSPKKRAKTVKRPSVSRDEIKMSSDNAPKVKEQNKKNMRVLAGKKLERSQKMKSMGVIIAVIAVIILAFETILPAGIIQTISNITAVAGTGSYPISVAGSQILNTVPMGNYYFVLTDTHLSAYANSGKELFSESHAFEKPVLAVSRGRAIIYNQGGKQAYIYDLSERKATVETENEIICASISDSGRYAIVTHSEKYASAVSVYNKANKLIFEWYSAEETINNIAVSQNGRKLAVSTYNSSSGVFNSKVKIINYKSATPEHTKTYDNTLIYALKSSNRSGFNIIKSNGIDYLKWSSYKLKEYSNDYTASLYRSDSSYNTLVFRRESDKTDNQIVILSKSGKQKHTVRYKGLINDIQVKGSNIYLINDSDVVVLDFEGKVSRKAEYGFGGMGIAVTSTNTVAVISDSEIKRIKLGEKE